MARATRIALDIALVATKAIKPAAGTAWQYAKIEMVPPLTVAFFTGPAGRKIENAVSNAASGLITSLESMIRDMDAEEARQIRLKEEAIRAAQEKLKAEAKLAKEKAMQKALEAQKAKAKAKAMETKKEEPPSPPPKAKPAKKKPVKDKKKPKRGGKK
ncbi:uncharacterized protein [Battus philenor]|uniref:uncharacterized protein n=1 Tax=Battus philenor TaxID=42288 RepID=UPI0035D124CE